MSLSIRWSKAHGGRIANTAGDSLLIEFASAVDAVRFSIAMQEGLAERNRNIVEDRRVVFRIGINVGDVIAEGDDLLGDGVNIAARVEALAEPGGINLTRSAADQVRDRLDLALEDMGEAEVKNIARPVHVFRVVPGGAPAAVKGRRRKATSGRRAALAAVAVLIAAIGGAFWWWQPWATRVATADTARMAHPLPDRPSIAVLPFDNLSGDPAQDKLIASLATDIIFALSRIKAIFVIDRLSTAAYMDKAAPAHQVAEALGVRYVMQGGIDRQGDRLRVTAQLIDALAGESIWSERYDRTIGDLFAVRDEITRRIVEHITQNIGSGEQIVMPESQNVDLEAWLLVYEAAEHANAPTPEHLALGLKQLARAVELAPDWAQAYMWRSVLLRLEVQFGSSRDPEASMQAAWDSAQKAKTLAPDHPGVYSALAGWHVLRGDFEEGVTAGDRAIELAPTNAPIVGTGAMIHFLVGEPDAAIAYGRQALRLTPGIHLRWIMYWVANAELLLGETDKAEALYREILSGDPEALWIATSNAFLALIEAERGNEDEAARMMAKALELAPYFRASDLLKGVKDPSSVAPWLETWKRLGMPE